MWAAAHTTHCLSICLSVHRVRGAAEGCAVSGERGDPAMFPRDPRLCGAGKGCGSVPPALGCPSCCWHLGLALQALEGLVLPWMALRDGGTGL